MEKDDETTRALALKAFWNAIVMECYRIMRKNRLRYLATSINKIEYNGKDHLDRFPLSRSNLYAKRSQGEWKYLSGNSFAKKLRAFFHRLFIQITVA